MRAIVCAIAFALVLCAVPVTAEIQHLDPEDHGCAEDMSTEDCFSDPTGTVVYGGQYIACSAKGSFGQGCWAVVEVPTSNGSLVKKCGKVRFEAACSCDSATLTAKGFCTYMR